MDSTRPPARPADPGNPGGTPGTTVPTPDALAAAFAARADAAAIRSWLGEAPDAGARQAVLDAVQAWARSHHRWDVLDALWHALSEDAAGLTDTALAGFLDVPAEARTRHPVLTWARAMAEAAAAQPPRSPADAFLGRLAHDSAALHADWSLREDTDEAVTAGTVRMVGERWLPASGHPLDAAWRARGEVDTFIDERSRRGQPPGRFAHSFFRAMSGRLALLRADPRRAVEEARWAGILAEGPPVTLVARAIEILAHSLVGEVHSADDAAGAASRPADFRFGGLDHLAAVMFALARGRRALQSLDREGVEASLRLVGPDAAAVAGLRAPRATLLAYHSGLWGEPTEGLKRLLATLSRHPVATREQGESADGVLVGRVREFLLSRIGAFEAAAACADALPGQHRVASRARAHLWAGQAGAAVRLVGAALPSPDLLMVDRLQLLLIQGAGSALDGRVPHEVRTATEQAMRELLRTRNYLPLAVLPPPARTAVLELCSRVAEEAGYGGPMTELQQRLARVHVGRRPGSITKPGHHPRSQPPDAARE